MNTRKIDKKESQTTVTTMNTRKKDIEHGEPNRCFAFDPVLLLSVSVTAIVAAVQDVTKDCQPTFPGYHITNDYEAKHQGCYKTSGGVFPAQAMVDIPFDFDWKKMFRIGHGKDLVQKCGSIAIENGVRYFGIFDYSDCFYGNTSD
ncbi:hypothetical protein PoB_006677400 [Plakobranchus ocellatus]|uniref:Uncharacterized protein n=1 Tax=Plakobranchus ocellatus TaxID=259542 RepID=A0AAV4D7T1_9GAST|nr:hypothetical protein PoB_006677400 [Plakobranchus ocellatus]